MAVATVVVCLLTALTLFGCTSTTRAAGPAADASHETRVERAGSTSTRRIEIRVRPGEGTEGRSHEGTEGGDSDQRDSDGGAEGAQSAPPQERAAGRGGAGVSGAPALPAAVGGDEAPRHGGTKARRVMPLRALLVAAVVGQSGSESRATQDAGSESRATPPHTDLDAVLDAAARLAEQRGVEVEIVVDEYEHEPLTADTTRSSLDETGATLATRSREAALGFNTTLRRFPLPWGGEARGGGFGFEAELLGGHGANALHLIGAAVMCLAVIPLLRTPRRWGSAAVFAGTGLAVVMTGTLVDRYPWVTLLAAVVLLGLLAYGAYEAWRRGRLTRSLDAITPVVERAPNSPELKTLIGQRAGRLLAAVKAETRASKARARG